MSTVRCRSCSSTERKTFFDVRLAFGSAATATATFGGGAIEALWFSLRTYALLIVRSHVVSAELLVNFHSDALAMSVKA